MFICTPCLNESYKNPESYGKSFGTCEVCKDRMLCNDIKSSNLISKDYAKFVVHVPSGAHVEVAKRINNKVQFTNELAVMLDDNTQVTCIEGDANRLYSIGDIRDACIRQVADDIKKEFGFS